MSKKKQSRPLTTNELTSFKKNIRSDNELLSLRIGNMKLLMEYDKIEKLYDLYAKNKEKLLKRKKRIKQVKKIFNIKKWFHGKSLHLKSVQTGPSG